MHFTFFAFMYKYFLNLYIPITGTGMYIIYKHYSSKQKGIGSTGKSVQKTLHKKYIYLPF